MDAVNRISSLFLRAMLVRMKELGLNKSALARRLNVSRAYVTKVFDGKANFTFASAYHFARALQMDFTPQLTIDSESDPPSPLPSSSHLSTVQPFNLSTPAFAMA